MLRDPEQPGGRSGPGCDGIFSGCPQFGPPCPPLVGAGPKPLETWALVAVPEEAVAPEDFDSLVFDVQTLLGRIDALEASDDVQDANIQSLRDEAIALQARVAAIEELPSIRRKLARSARRGE